MFENFYCIKVYIKVYGSSRDCSEDCSDRAWLNPMDLLQFIDVSTIEVYRSTHEFEQVAS